MQTLFKNLSALIATAVVSVSAPGFALDVILLKNGDRLSGSIKSMDPHSVIINLKYAGEVNIARDAIDQLKTGQPHRVMLRDKTLTFGDIEKQSDDTTIVHDSVTGTEKICSFTEMAYINPPPHISGEGSIFTGEINLGGEWKEGNTVSTKLRLDFNTQYDRGIRRWLFNGNTQWESKNRDKTEDNWFIQGRYNRLFAEKWYVLGNMSLEYDEFKGLNLRSVTGGGAGYRFFDDPHDKLSIEAGPNFVYEDYQDEPRHINISFRESLTFEYPLFRSRILFYHHHSLLQGLNDTDTLSVKTSTGIKIPLGLLGISTSLQLDWDWDKKPTSGRKNSDTTFTLKGGYDW